MAIYATRYHDISCGHRVYGHESKCANLHGHNYRIWFTVTGKPLEGGSERLDSVGRVLDFASIKELLCSYVEHRWDHRFLIWEKDPMYMKLYALDQTVIPVTFNPTAENMAKFLVDVIGPIELKDTNVELIKCTVEETRKCSATYEKNR